MQESDAAHKQALVLVEEQLTEASKTLEDERAQRRRMVEAAAAGQISVQALSTSPATWKPCLAAQYQPQCM